MILPQVLRYTFLGLGVFYGFTHQRSITASQKAAAAQKEYDHKQKLIDQAKAEWAKKNAPVETKAASSGTIPPARDIDNDTGALTLPFPAVADFNDPKFDLEAYLTQLAKENP